MRIQNLLDRMICFHVSGPPIQFDEEDQVYFPLPDIIQKMQHDLALCDRFPCGVAFIPVDINDLITMLVCVLNQIVFLCLERITVHGLLLRGHTDIERSTDHILGRTWVGLVRL